MTTQLISLNEYRKNISTLWKKSQEENIKYIVLVHSKPVLEVKPIFDNVIEDNWDTQYTNENHKSWLEAREELKKGEALKVDFDKIKNESDFISLLKS